MSHNYAYFSDEFGFERFEDLAAVQDKNSPPAERFALAADSELAKRPAHQKVHETLQGSARAEKRRYFAPESEAQKSLKAERLFTRAQALENKLIERKGRTKS